MPVVEWFDNHEGFAISALTLALVIATVWGAWTTRAALRIARDGHELDRRTRRGANVVIRFHEGARFHAWARGPSDATAISVRLETMGYAHALPDRVAAAGELLDAWMAAPSG